MEEGRRSKDYTNGSKLGGDTEGQGPVWQGCSGLKPRYLEGDGRGWDQGSVCP